ncbi:hypothetical protein [Stenotrophomonas sp. PS02297]|uniref:hypothetical protein n=1 Tax=Stenotrophomonas sp. PS02297 TaxID=2991423 RepID=UPI00249AC8FC|nr:hypothetical protein [Stenotrophomonas sp. PS02297]
MIEVAARSAVVLTGIYLVVLGTMALLVPSRAATFLLGFAGSPAAPFHGRSAISRSSAWHRSLRGAPPWER